MKNSFQHIILISIDNLRSDCIHASPRYQEYLRQYRVHVALETGILDQILSSGLYFDNCFSAAPYTSASHAAYFTGMWPLHNGIYEFFNRTLRQPTIFQRAKDQGLTTLFQTDFPIILGSALGFTRGIDHYFVENETAAFAALVRQKRNKTLSFFHFGAVHYPYGFHTLKFGGKDYVNKVRSLENKYDIPHAKRHTPEDVLTETFRTKKDSELLLRYKYIIEILYRKGLYDDLFQLYLEGINYFFRSRFNTFLAKVQRFVDSHNGILFLFADHGEDWDFHSEGHHNTLSESVLRVPLVVYGKNVRPTIEKRLVRTIDLAPTIMTLLPHAAIPSDMDGLPFDLFHSGKTFPFPSHAISQVWTSLATKKQIASFQMRSAATPTRARPLKTYLSGESIRTQDRKFTAYFAKDGSVVRKESTGKVADLKKMMVTYNHSWSNEGTPLQSVESIIKSELSNLGYNV